MSEKLTDYELGAVRMLVPAECTALLSCVDDMVREIRTSRASLPALELGEEERKALKWLLDQQNGLTLANRVGAAEGECDANGDELPGEWVPTLGGLALRTLDRLCHVGASKDSARVRLAALELTQAEREDVVEICHYLSGRAILYERDHESSDEGDPGLELAAEYRRKEATLRRLLAATETVEDAKGRGK